MSTAADATVSVVVPAYESGRYLGETIEAVLAQTRPADELVVVDDGSTDDSGAIAEAFGPAVRVLREAHAGIAASRHRGYEATTGDLVANCDSDDLWLPTKLERQIAALTAAPELDAVGCLVDEFLSPDVDPSLTPGRGLRIAHPAHFASALLIRRRFLDRMGGYRNEHQVGEALQWWAQALEAGLRAGMVDEVLTRRRIHAHNTSRAAAQRSEEYLQVVHEHIRRRRDPPS